MQLINYRQKAYENQDAVLAVLDGREIRLVELGRYLQQRYDPGILERWEVTLVALAADNEDLRPFIAADPGWRLLHEDDEGAVYQRVG